MSKKKAKSKKLSWSHQFRRLLWLLTVPLSLMLIKLAASHPQRTEEIYSRSIYPVLRRIFISVNSCVPFSLAELLIFSAAALIAISTVVLFIRLLFRRTKPVVFFKHVVTLAIAAAMLFNSFYLLWGFNFMRPGVAELMGLNVENRPLDQLEELCYTLLSDAEELRATVFEDENGVYAFNGERKDYLSKIPKAYERLSAKYPLFDGDVGMAKELFTSELFSRFGISGIYIPYTFEPNINIDQPPLLILSSAAHETAHQLGFSKENEANFIAYLACSESDDPCVRYSGTILALIHCANKLNANDRQAYYELYSSYSAGIKRDLENYNKYWNAYTSSTSKAVDKINDSYLKFNSQTSGTKSYGEVVDLLLAYFYGSTSTAD